MNNAFFFFSKGIYSFHTSIWPNMLQVQMQVAFDQSMTLIMVEASLISPICAETKTNLLNASGYNYVILWDIRS